MDDLFIATLISYGQHWFNGTTVIGVDVTAGWKNRLASRLTTIAPLPPASSLVGFFSALPGSLVHRLIMLI